jgi:hypothetical protein
MRYLFSQGREAVAEGFGKLKNGKIQKLKKSAKGCSPKEA